MSRTLPGLEYITGPVPRRYQLSPLRALTLEAVEEHIVELNDIIVAISGDLMRVQGADDETPKVYNHMDFNYNRATNLADPLADQDAVTKGFLRRYLKDILGVDILK